MTPSFVFVIYVLVYPSNSMEWANIWFDNANNQGDWVCPTGDGEQGDHCKFGEWSNAYCKGGEGYCHKLCHKNYIERSIPISVYAGRPLRLSLYVSMEDGPEWSTSDRCRIWFAYNDDDHDINKYDWECTFYSCGKVVIIDIPASESDTLTIVLGAYDKAHAHCNFDSLELEYLLPPTPAPTDRPTPIPTKQPTDQTKSPTSAPTTLPTEAPTSQPSRIPTKQPTLTPTSQPS
eukprot:248237_1